MSDAEFAKALANGDIDPDLQYYIAQKCSGVLPFLGECRLMPHQPKKRAMWLSHFGMVTSALDL